MVEFKGLIVRGKIFYTSSRLLREAWRYRGNGRVSVIKNGMRLASKERRFDLLSS